MACEGSISEHLWSQLNLNDAPAIDGELVADLVSNCGLSKDILRKCWNVSINNSERRTITKDEFFVFMRCIVFVQKFGVNHLRREEVLRLENLDQAIPSLRNLYILPNHGENSTLNNLKNTSLQSPYSVISNPPTSLQPAISPPTTILQSISSSLQSVISHPSTYQYPVSSIRQPTMSPSPISFTTPTTSVLNQNLPTYTDIGGTPTILANASTTESHQIESVDWTHLLDNSTISPTVLIGAIPNSEVGDMCICGDTVHRPKPDSVRLRCGCVIHAACLAKYIKSSLSDASQVSGEGIRCCYWYSCGAKISPADVERFSQFVYQRGAALCIETGGAAGDGFGFGANDVNKFARFAVTASFSEKDLVYCPSCEVPCWVDDSVRSRSKRAVCANPKCNCSFCMSCLVPWHKGMTCTEYVTTCSTSDQLSQRFIAATSKPCPACSTPFTHYHGHSCHHISPAGATGGGCPSCHVHFCYACLSTEHENRTQRGDRKACRCPKGKWSTYCESVDIEKYLVDDPYPHDMRCGCPICPDCSFGNPCGGRGSSSGCDGSCVVCLGMVAPGPRNMVLRRPDAAKRDV